MTQRRHKDEPCPDCGRTPKTTRRHKGDGGLAQRHDADDCPPMCLTCRTRAEHTCHGRWVGTIETTLDGTRKRKTVYGRTKREAQAKLKEALKQRDAGTLVVSTTTVEKWMDRWLERSKLKPQTKLSYKSKIEQYIKPQLGRVRLTSLRPTQVDDLYDWMRDTKGLSESTIRQTHAILHKALKDAMKKGLLANNPVDRADAPTTKTGKRVQLSTDQARAVLKAAGDDPRWWLAVFYGMRQGEVLGLKWGDVDFEQGVLHVERTLQLDENRRLHFGDPKSDTSIRPLPLMPQVAIRLRLLHDAVNPGPDDLIFPGSKGGPKQPKRDWRDWRELLEKADAPPIALHAARNSAASLLEAAGVPDRLAMQILGHSQVQMTHRYQTADVDRMRQALEGTSRLLELE